MRFTNAAGILVCLVLIFGLTLYVSPLALPSIPPVRGTTHTISLVGNNPNWNTSNPNPIITVTKGDTVTINLSSGDAATHQLLIDFDGDYAGGTDCTAMADWCSSTFSPSTPTRLGPFTITSNAGQYKYYCTVHYPYMQGLFIVENPPGQDFQIAANPSSPSILQGSNANSTITVSSINNFAGTITLSASASPPGPMTNFSTNTVVVSSGTTASSKLTISIPPSTSLGSYGITVTGTNGSSSGTHTTNISVSVVSPSSPNFMINSNPTSLTVAQDSSGTISITLTSVNSFAGTITLSAAVSPSGPQASFNPSSVTLTSGGSASSTLKVSTTASTSGYYSTPVALGSYAINVTALSGPLSHSTTVSLTVGSTSAAPPGSSSLPLLPIAGGVIALVAVIGTVLFLRRRKH